MMKVQSSLPNSRGAVVFSSEPVGRSQVVKKKKMVLLGWLSCCACFLVLLVLESETNRRSFFVSALSRDDLQNVACDLESFIVEEASTKSQLLEVLGGWDASSEMQVLVFNGHFATGKTYISYEQEYYIVILVEIDDRADNSDSSDTS